MSKDTVPKAPKKRRLLVILLILVAFAAGGGAGFYWWSKHKKTDDNAEVAKIPPPPAPIFMPLGTFTINLVTTDNSTDSVLYIGLTLRLPDEETLHHLTDFLPEVRSRLLRLLTQQKAEQLASEQGKQQLVTGIKQVLNPPLVENQPAVVVSDVLFTDFILR